MIITKITVLLILITVFYWFAINVWVNANPAKALVASIGGKRPKWLNGIGYLIILDAIGIFASVVWALFFR